MIIFKPSKKAEEKIEEIKKISISLKNEIDSLLNQYHEECDDDKRDQISYESEVLRCRWQGNNSRFERVMRDEFELFLHDGEFEEDFEKEISVFFEQWLRIEEEKFNRSIRK